MLTLWVACGAAGRPSVVLGDRRIQQAELYGRHYLGPLSCTSPAAWFSLGTKLPTSHAQLFTRADLRGERQCFVETGTNKGDTALAVASKGGYALVTTIEKLARVHQAASERFQRHGKNISALLGDTTDVLPGLLAMPPHYGACVFLLDAHNTYGSKDWAKTPVNPLLQELTIILEAPHSHKSYIVLDDYRLFGVNSSASMSAEARAEYAPYPSAAEILAHVCAAKPRARFLVGMGTMHISIHGSAWAELPSVV